MVVHATNISTKYRFEYTGGATSKTARMRSLAANGKLWVAKDHVLAVLLPDALYLPAAQMRWIPPEHQ